MTDALRISIAEDFDEYPVGRDKLDNENENGAVFREKVLLPKVRVAISEGKKLVVDFDGVKSCGSSFLESAFGGLVRLNGIDKETLLNLLVFEYSAERYGRYERSARNHIQKATPGV